MPPTKLLIKMNSQENLKKNTTTPLNASSQSPKAPKSPPKTSGKRGKQGVFQYPDGTTIKGSSPPSKVVHLSKLGGNLNREVGLY